MRTVDPSRSHDAAACTKEERVRPLCSRRAKLRDWGSMRMPDHEKQRSRRYVLEYVRPSMAPSSTKVLLAAVVAAIRCSKGNRMTSSRH